MRKFRIKSKTLRALIENELKGKNKLVEGHPPPSPEINASLERYVELKFEDEMKYLLSVFKRDPKEFDLLDEKEKQTIKQNVGSKLSALMIKELEQVYGKYFKWPDYSTSKPRPQFSTSVDATKF